MFYRSESGDVIVAGRFQSLSMDNFRCIAVLGRGHFGKVCHLCFIRSLKQHVPPRVRTLRVHYISML